MSTPRIMDSECLEELPIRKRRRRRREARKEKND
jgi:hypothetical protein